MGKIRETLLQQCCSHDKDWMSLGEKYVLKWCVAAFHISLCVERRPRKFKQKKKSDF